ncbi:MAG: zinc ribbon domain-containing protein [Candidatus Melainabacteria bacterium]|nr:zinc ribbon domain-containing protein [Candidatus Melainabacteria bacterium]
MPNYDYRCKDCREPFSVERSMKDNTEPNCEHCGSAEVNRIWNIQIRSGGITPDVGQGSSPKSSGGSSGGGCGSCCGSSCSSC